MMTMMMLRIYQDYLVSDQLLFGFKEKSSCTHALFTVTESVVEWHFKKIAREKCPCNIRTYLV